MVMPLVFVVINVNKLFWGDITVKSMFLFMLNKRKCKNAAWGSPQAPLGDLSALPLLSREGHAPSLTLPAYEYSY